MTKGPASTTIKAGEGFTVQQLLNSNGFTLDTTDFVDLLDDDEEGLELQHRVDMNNQEMLKLLYLEDDDEGQGVPENNEAFVGIAFETLLPRMTSIYGDGEVMKLVKRPGSGEVVPPDAQVTVEYVGYFEYRDEPFDSTLFQKDKKAVLRLGKGQVIEGLDIAIRSMHKNEKSIFIIKPHLAYKEMGCPPRIPPNETVLFKVELVNFLDNGSADLYDELTPEDKKKFTRIEKIVRDLMNTANDSFQRQKYKQSIREYNRAVHYLEFAHLDNDQEEENMNKLLNRALMNLTVVYNKINKPKLACSCFQRLPYDKPNAKAEFQYGKALAQLGEYDEAMSHLNKAYKMQPNEEKIRKAIHEVEICRKKYAEFFKRFAQNSLRLKDHKPNEFEMVAQEMCDTFVKDTSLQKQQIPEGLSTVEKEIIRKVAATFNLSVMKQTRFGIESMYLTKRGYYAGDKL